MIHGVNAAGLSAFNPVERRMAPLSHDLCGIILPHDTFGSHLDSSGKTIDNELEKENFHAAAEVLSEVWSKTVINNFPVDCKAVRPGCELKPSDASEDWLAKHVKQTRYALQIVKCLNPECCEPFQTNWLTIFPSRFLPPPAIYTFGKTGLEVVEPSVYFADQLKVSNQTKYKFATLKERLVANLISKEAIKSKNGIPRPMPFDSYCPSMEEKLDDCICQVCGSCWPCAAAVKRHMKAHGKKNGNTDSMNMAVPSSEVTDEMDGEEESIGIIDSNFYHIFFQ